MSLLLRLEVVCIFQSLSPPIDWEEAIYQHLLRQRARGAARERKSRNGGPKALKVRADRLRDARADRRRRGLCDICGAESGGGKCERHRTQYAAYARAAWARRAVRS